MREPPFHNRLEVGGKGHRFKSDFVVDSTSHEAFLPGQMVKLPGYEVGAAIPAGQAPELKAGDDRINAEYVGKTENEKRTLFRQWFIDALNPPISGPNVALGAIRRLATVTPADLGLVTATELELYNEQVVCRVFLEMSRLVGMKPSEMENALGNLREGKYNIGVNRLPAGSEWNFLFRNIKVRGLPTSVTPANALQEIDQIAHSPTHLDNEKYTVDAAGHNIINRGYGAARRGHTFAGVVKEAETSFSARVSGGNTPREADAKFMVQLAGVVAMCDLRPAELSYPDPKYDKTVADSVGFRTVLKAGGPAYVAEQFPERFGVGMSTYLNASKDAADTPAGLGLSQAGAIFDPRCLYSAAELKARDFTSADTRDLKTHYALGTGEANMIEEILAGYAKNPRVGLLALSEKIAGLWSWLPAEVKLAKVIPMLEIFMEGCMAPNPTRTRLHFEGGKSIFVQEGLNEGGKWGAEDVRRYLLDKSFRYTLFNVGDAKLTQAIIGGEVAQYSPNGEYWLGKGANFGVGLVGEMAIKGGGFLLKSLFGGK